MIDSVAGDAVSVKLGGALTVSATAVDAVRLPEVPVTVTVARPTVAVLLAVSVSTLLPVVGLVAKAAVTPVGRPEATRVTLPVNPFAPTTAIVDVPLDPWTTVRDPGEAVSVKLGGGAVIVSGIVMVAHEPSEIPVMVIVAGPTVAVLLAVSVRTLEPVEVGFGANDAVTPLGRPEADRVTLPVNPFAGTTWTVSVPVDP